MRLLFPVHVLTADADVAFPHDCRHGGKARKRRADNNLLRGMRFKVGQAFIQELFGMGGVLYIFQLAAINFLRNICSPLFSV